MNSFSGSKPVAGKIGNLMLKQTACAPSLGLLFSVKLSSLKVSILFQSNFPVTAASIPFSTQLPSPERKGSMEPPV